MQEQTLREKRAQIFKALSHPIRLHIVELLLSGEKCVNDIRDFFEVTQPNISQHLNILKFAGIVDSRQDKNLRCYYLRNPQQIENIVKTVE
jgi:ArsR family transcriptional regulator